MKKTLNKLKLERPTLLFLCIFLLFSDLAACSKQIKTDSTEETQVTIEKPDLTETDELLIYVENTNKSRMQIAIKAFEETYPNVNLNAEVLGQDEYMARLRVEIPAGDGPDAVWGVDTYLPDVYKTIGTGVFTALSPYFKTDENFNCEDYIPATWTSGVLDGKQYIVPLQFELGSLLTTEEILAENGISQDGIETFDGFMDACLTFHQNNPDKELFNFGANTHYFNGLILRTGTRFLDSDNAAFPFRPENLKLLADVSKAWYPGNITEYMHPTMGEDGLLARDFFFMTNIYTPTAAVMKMAYLQAKDETPILVSVRNPDDKCLAAGFDFMAIPVGSANILNAYRFIKMTLSYDYQSDQKGLLHITPVLKEAIEDGLSSSLDRYIKDEEFHTYIHDKVTNIVDAIDEIDHYRPALRSSVYEIMEPYIEGKSDFENAYNKLLNYLTIYKDE